MIDSNKNMIGNKKGFTLIELIIVMAIISILVAISYPKFSAYRELSRQKELASYKNILEKSVRQYYAIEGEFPSSIDELGANNYGVVVDKNKYDTDFKTQDNKITITVRLHKNK